MDGDLVAVKPASTVENGKIAVVLLDDEATVKRVFFEKNRVTLQPANKSKGYKTRYVKPGQADVRIVGKVVSCLRSVG